MAKSNSRKISEIIVRLDNAIKDEERLSIKYYKETAKDIGTMKAGTNKYAQACEMLEDVSAQMIASISDLKTARELLYSTSSADSDIDIDEVHYTSIVNKLDKIDSNKRIEHAAYLTFREQSRKILNEIKEWLEAKERDALSRQNEESMRYQKEKAMNGMMRKRKGVITLVVVLLLIIAASAIVLGILSEVGIIDSMYGGIIGSFDCAFGIIFFVYEFCDDKLKSKKINAGDEEIINKYSKYIDNRNVQKGFFVFKKDNHSTYNYGMPPSYKQEQTQEQNNVNEYVDNSNLQSGFFVSHVDDNSTYNYYQDNAQEEKQESNKK